MNKQYKKISTLYLLTIPYLLNAQTTVLDEIIIEENIPIKTNSIEIDMDKIEQNQAITFKEIFKNNSSIEIGGGAINTQRIYLRGLESSNLNISLDGAKQGKNMFQHRSNELGISPFLLKTVDVKTSTDARKSSALGGSIEMTTKDAQDFVKGDKKYGAILTSSYSTNSKQKLGSVSTYDVFNENLGAYFSINGINSLDYKDANKNKEIGTNFKNRDYLFKISLLDLKDNDLRLTINQNKNSTNSRWRGTEYRPLPNELEEIVSTTTNYILNHNYNPNNLLNLDTKLSLTDINLERKDENRKYDNRNLSLQIKNSFDFDILNTNNIFILGTELEKEHGKGSFHLEDLKPADKDITKYSDLDTQNLSFFIQNRTQFDKLGIDYGLRFDNYIFKSGLGKAKDNTLSPNLGIDYKLNENSLIYANYGKASRMSGIIPFTWSLNTKIDSKYSNRLKAEKSNRYEFGYSFEKNDSFLNDDYISLNINLFHTKLKDFIVSKDTNCSNGRCGSGEGGWTLQDIYNRNDDFRSKGFEIKLYYAHDIFSTSFGYTQTKTNAKNNDSNNVLGINEDQNIRRVGGYDSKKFVWNSELEIANNLFLNYTLNANASSQILDSNNLKSKRAGYTSHDINAKYDFNKNLTLFVGANNITNKLYANAMTISTKNQSDSYRYEMGRDYRFSVKYVF